MKEVKEVKEVKGKFLNKEDLEQFNARLIALNQGQLLLQMANREAQLFTADVLKKHKIEDKKKYKIDSKTGEILEIKEESIKENEVK